MPRRADGGVLAQCTTLAITHGYNLHSGPDRGSCLALMIDKGVFLGFRHELDLAFPFFLLSHCDGGSSSRPPKRSNVGAGR